MDIRDLTPPRWVIWVLVLCAVVSIAAYVMTHDTKGTASVPVVLGNRSIDPGNMALNAQKYGNYTKADFVKDCTTNLRTTSFEGQGMTQADVSMARNLAPELCGCIYDLSREPRFSTDASMLTTEYESAVNTCAVRQHSLKQ